MAYDEQRPEPTTAPDTPNATKFDARDGDYNTHSRLDGSESFHEYYRRLSTLNSGIWTGTWADKELLREQDNLAIFDAIANQLELTDYQHRRGRHEFSQLNLSNLSSPNGIDTALVAFCVAAIVVREDGRQYDPERRKDRNDDAFVALSQRLGFKPHLIKKTLGKVASRTDL